jgi:hypothetical protein
MEDGNEFHVGADAIASMEPTLQGGRRDGETKHVVGVGSDIAADWVR